MTISRQMTRPRRSRWVVTIAGSFRFRFPPREGANELEPRRRGANRSRLGTA
jgi:hypothetical protein